MAKGKRQKANAFANELIQFNQRLWMNVAYLSEYNFGHDLLFIMAIFLKLLSPLPSIRNNVHLYLRG
jgi:hypothetical protein